ncbi:hypothetical protein [Methylobacterium indicum]|uniref:hypothetical protein n=1 Tax=Methylobacterium indicum TaxID=1775910 RepID=UPI000B076D2E|nr:hypothetical protein [Methylobacterium indicum]
MDAQRKRLARNIKHLECALAAGDIENFASILHQHESPLFLKAIQEQKILLRANIEYHEIITNLLTVSANKVLTSTEVGRFVLYMMFVKEFKIAQVEIKTRLESIIRILPKMNFVDLIGVFSRSSHVLFNGVSPPTPMLSQTVADYERRLHDFNGYGNDIVSSLLRAINETSKIALDVYSLPLSRSKRQAAERRLLGITRISAELNALEWVFDSVSYGEFVVTHVGQAPDLIIRLEYADARRTLIRTLAIRREFILDYNFARAPRVLRDTLLSLENSVLEGALRFYCSTTGAQANSIDFRKIRQLSKKFLIQIKAEDDLLCLSGGKNALCPIYYTIAIVLRWFFMTAIAVRDSLPSSERRHFLSPPIPLNYISDCIEGGDLPSVNKAFDKLTCTLPSPSHYDLVRRPFIRNGLDVAHGVAMPLVDPWATSVREALISGGGVGNSYGQIWEVFFEHSFKDSDWKILGRSLKLRQKGKLVTDLDLLAKRDDLLLVIQIKALAGSSVSPYDHWRNRQTIEWGCRQAAAATDFLRQEPHWLVSVAGRSLANEIRHVQPLVLTTINHVDGWEFEGVPVIGEAGRKAITEGSKVVYSSQRTREIFATKHITKPEELSTERILWSLKNPIEILIAPEKIDTTYRIGVAGRLRFELPQFKIDTAMDDIPVLQREIK